MISNFLNKFFIALIEFYRSFISPLNKPCCRFYPTCSEYALQAFSRYRFLKAFFLSLYRIIRCHPFCKGGYDPLP